MFKRTGRSYSGAMLALFVLSVGLAMDAFAVSLVRGSVGRRSLLHAGELGLAFGTAQGLMPLIGWALADRFGEAMRMVDHWIAFLLLGALGGRMLVGAWRGRRSAQMLEAPAIRHHSRLLGLLVAAFATSIDAAAAGLTFDVLALSLPVACLTIGVTTAALCTVGYLLGARASTRWGPVAEVMGGVVLIGLGIRILLDHLAL